MKKIKKIIAKKGKSKGMKKRKVKRRTEKLFMKFIAVFMILLIILLPIQIGPAAAATAAPSCYRVSDFDVDKSGKLNETDKAIINDCYMGNADCPAGNNCDPDGNKVQCESTDITLLSKALDRELIMCDESAAAGTLIDSTGVYSDSIAEEDFFGYIPLKEEPTFVAYVNMPEGETLAGESIMVNDRNSIDGGLYFVGEGSSCEKKTGNMYKCEFRDILKEVSDEAPLTAGEKTMHFMLLDSNNEIRDSSEFNFIVDDMPPHIYEDDIKIPELKEGNIILGGYYEMTIKLQDGVDSSQTIEQSPNKDKCSGVRDVTVYVRGYKDMPLMQDKDVFKRNPGCLYENSTYIDLGGAAQGANDICVQATDYFGYESGATCISVDYDSLPPQYVDNSLAITDKDGKDYSYVGGEMACVNVSAEFDEAHDTTGVVMEELTGMQTPSPLPGSCIKPYGEYNHTLCWWSCLDFDFTGKDNLQAQFTAEDNLGNKDLTPQIVDINQAIDSTPPGAAQLTTNYITPSVVYIRGFDNSTQQTLLQMQQPVIEGDTVGRALARDADRAASKALMAEYDSENTTIYMNFDETEAGFGSANVYLNLESLGLGANVKADNCAALYEESEAEEGGGAGSQTMTAAEIINAQAAAEEAANQPVDETIVEGAVDETAEEMPVIGWQCIWNNVNSPFTASEMDDLEIFLTSDSKDDAGNSLDIADGRGVFRVSFDSVRPALNNTPYHRCYSQITVKNICKGGDNMEAKAVVLDSHPISAELVSYNSNGAAAAVPQSADACNQINSGVYECIWPKILMPSVYNDSVTQTISMFFTDPANHTTNYSFDVEVLGNMNELNPNHWTHDPAKIIAVPEKIDRGLVPVSTFEVKQFFSVPLDTASSEHNNDKILRLTLANNTCTGSNGTENYIDFSRTRLMNNVGNDPRNPYLAIYYTARDIDVNSLQIDCTFEIMTRHGNYVITNLEYEKVRIKIDLTGESIGEAGKRIQKEIADARARADKWKKGVLGKLLKLYGMYKKICGIIEKIESITESIERLAMAVGIIFEAAPGPLKVGVMPVSKSMNSVAAQMNKLSAQMKKMNDKFCKYMHCNKNTMGGKEDVKLGGGKFTGSDVENNFFLSAMFLCLPGIMNGIEKLRQIDCNYARCMEENIPQGLTKDVCDRGRAYAKCKFVYGAFAGIILSLVASGAQEFIGEFKKWMEDPIGSLLDKFANKCDSSCFNAGSTCSGCLLPAILTAIQEMQNLKGLLNFDETFKLEDQC